MADPQTDSIIGMGNALANREKELKDAQTRADELSSQAHQLRLDLAARMKELRLKKMNVEGLGELYVRIEEYPVVKDKAAWLEFAKADPEFVNLLSINDKTAKAALKERRDTGGVLPPPSVVDMAGFRQETARIRSGK